MSRDTCIVRNILYIGRLTVYSRHTLMMCLIWPVINRRNWHSTNGQLHFCKNKITIEYQHPSRHQFSSKLTRLHVTFNRWAAALIRMWPVKTRTRLMVLAIRCIHSTMSSKDSHAALWHTWIELLPWLIYVDMQCFYLKMFRVGWYKVRAAATQLYKVTRTQLNKVTRLCYCNTMLILLSVDKHV